MKRTVVNVTTSVLAFMCGLSVASYWNGNGTVKNEGPKVIDCSSTPAPAAVVETAPAPDAEVVFGGGRLRIVAEEIHLKSERLRYEVNVTYPQILGSEDRHIRKLNQRLEQVAIEQYQWLLTPSKKDLQYYRTGPHPEAFNSLDLDYRVVLATDSVLSIYFNAYSYGIGAAHSVQYSFVINYDLLSGKELKLARLFKRNSKYLEFISRYCSDKVSIEIPPGALFADELAPINANFESWNLTRDGIRFNFDACKLSGCAAGEHTVEIPYGEMKTILNTKMNLLKQLGV